MANLLSYKSRRSPTQNVIITFFVMLFSFFLFGVIPTQWFAYQYHYDSNLGEALFRTPFLAFYMPSNWVIWCFRLVDIPSLKHNVNIMLLLGSGSFGLSIIFSVLVSWWLGRYTPGMDGLHGTAHWAEKDDVDSTGFISAKGYTPKGVIIGSVMLDKRGEIIHPHHKDYAFRYKKKFIRGKGLKYFLKKPERNEHGGLKYEMRKEIVKKIELLFDGRNTHLFAFCPTRSGKGVSMILPTLLTWRDSVMTNDPKGEAYALTAGFRSNAGQHVIKFEPSCVDGSGARWNPLDEIRIFTLYDVQDAQMIMSMACDPKGEGLEDYFDKAGYEFLMGLALHMRYIDNSKNGSLEGVALFLGDPAFDSDKQMYTTMMTAIHDPEGKMGWKDSMGKPTKTHPIIANTAKTMLNKEDKDRSGVLSTAKSLLSLYLDPIVARNTNCSDFLVRDLMTGEKPVSLYYVVGPADMERMVPLTRLFYALFLRRNAADMEFADGRSTKNYTFPLLMIIDEMTSLRKLPILQEALGYVAGYGIRMFMLSQDIVQVEDLYGDKQTIDSGAETRIVFAPNKSETADKLASMAGKTTITEEKASTSRDMIGLKSGTVSISTDKVSRDLMTASEFMSLSDFDVVIFTKGQPPIYGRKSFYYENTVMLARAKIPAPKKSSVLRKTEVLNIDISVKAQQTEVEAPPDKWAASRAALKVRVASSVGTSPADADTNSSDNHVRPKSRYADKVRIISSEDRKQIEALVSNIALMDKVVRLSAF